jgi:predicted O-methyltransferase YrrM
MRKTSLKHLIQEQIKKPLRSISNALLRSTAHSSSTGPVNSEEQLGFLEPDFQAILTSLYRGDPQTGFDGQLYPIDKITRIGPRNGRWLYEFCVANCPMNSVEIGMAYGFSTMFIMAAMRKNGKGRHTSIDPFQNAHWKGIGVAHARKVSKPGVEFRFIEDRSDRAATDLARENEKFDLVFIDGNHKFDDVLVDFYLYAQLCSKGGCIIFDDAHMNSIQAVITYVRTNRPDFEEIPDLPGDWSAFRRVGDDTRHWAHFKKFPAAATSDSG